MKTTKTKLRLKILDWWPQPHRLKALWKTVLYKLWPDRCRVCRTRVDTSGRFFEGTVHRNQVMLAQFSARPICSKCLADKIKQYYIRAHLDVMQCSCCGAVTRVTGGIVDPNDRFNHGDADNLVNKAVAKRLNLLVRYGLNGKWNNAGPYNGLCQTCVVSAIMQNKPHTLQTLKWGSKTYYINHRGALIPSKRKPK